MGKVLLSIETWPQLVRSHKQSTWLAVLASLATARTSSLLASGSDSITALYGGYQLAFFAGTVFAASAGVLGAILICTGKPMPTPQSSGG